MYAEKACFQVGLNAYHDCHALTRALVDPSVMRDLQAHRSLDDTVASTGGGSGEGSGS
jgi:hypothetical protein